MSNTTEITPYLKELERETSSEKGSWCSGVSELVSWLREETTQDREAVARAREVQRQERLQAFLSQAATPRLTTVGLKLSSLEPLLHSAIELGYAPQPLAGHSPSSFRLQNARGERLAILKDRGRLVVSTAGDSKRVHALVRQHTHDRVLEHLQRRMAMDVKTARLPNGEIQISATETSPKHNDGQARMKIQLRQNGALWVDVDGLRSNRCEKVVADLAEAMGGEITLMKKKAEAFTLPGEPAKTRVHAWL